MKGEWGKASPFHLPVENNSTSGLKYWALSNREILFYISFYSDKRNVTKYRYVELVNNGNRAKASFWSKKETKNLIIFVLYHNCGKE